MKKQTLAVLAAMTMATGMPVAMAHEDGNLAADASFVDYATVRSAVPEYRRVSVPQQQCYTDYAPATQSTVNSPAAAVVGGIIGGLAGHQVGGGSGKTVATVAGTLAGAYLGDRLATNAATGYGYNSQPVQRCNTVNEIREELAGYRVNYTYRGKQFSTVTRQHPGQRLAVRVSVTPETY